MQLEYLRAFEKDLVKLDPVMKKRLTRLIEQLKKATFLTDIPQAKKLIGHSYAYRIRVGEYRLGIFLEGNTIQMARILHRKDIYSVFP